jgi:hypothetical protein
MDSVYHFHCDTTGWTDAEKHQAEAMMRDPHFQTAALAQLNALAVMVSAQAGFAHVPVITATIHTVTHR